MRGESTLRHSVALFSLLLGFAFFGASVQAACGGGGYKPSKQTTHQEVHPENPGSADSSTSRQSTVALDTSRFDNLSAKLELSEEQTKKISKAKREVRDRLAKGKYSESEGKSEFDRRLSGILSERQLKIYNARTE